MGQQDENIDLRLCPNHTSHIQITAPASSIPDQDATCSTRQVTTIAAILCRLIPNAIHAHDRSPYLTGSGPPRPSSRPSSLSAIALSPPASWRRFNLVIDKVSFELTTTDMAGGLQALTRHESNSTRAFSLRRFADHGPAQV